VTAATAHRGEPTEGNTSAGPIHLDRRGPVILLGLNRPTKYNALDEAMVDEIDRTLLEIRREPSILVVYSTTPGVFVAGADIAELVERDADAALRSINAGLFDRIEAHRWPTIAVIDGPAFGGGCELALACDLRVGSPRAKFAQPELGLGILAGSGANWRLPQAVGLPLARRMLYAGEVLDADAALAAGLVDAVHPPEELLDRAITLAESVAARSWRALELTKLALRAHRPATTSLDIVSQAVLFDGEDKRERMNRFLDDRAARRAARAAAEGSAAAAAPKPAPAQGPTVPDPVPPFRVRQLTIEDGLALATWSSPGAWHIEDALEAPEPDEGYWAVVDSGDNLLGFCCLGAAARVPGQPADEWLLDVAIGIRPQLAGRGWGGELGRAAVAYARSVALDRRVRTTVPDWNTAGQHAARLAGFTPLEVRVYHQQRYEVFEQPA
jgi:enoyl-CoA hydratase/carnithine racemase/RimJ/RimL family protein N-acetyltransferase